MSNQLIQYAQQTLKSNKKVLVQKLNLKHDKYSISQNIHQTHLENVIKKFVTCIERKNTQDQKSSQDENAHTDQVKIYQDLFKFCMNRTTQIGQFLVLQYLMVNKRQQKGKLFQFMQKAYQLDQIVFIFSYSSGIVKICNTLLKVQFFQITILSLSLFNSNMTYKILNKKDYRSKADNQLEKKYEYSLKFLIFYLNKVNLFFIDETIFGNTNRAMRPQQMKGNLSLRLFRGGKKVFAFWVLLDQKWNVNQLIYSYHLYQLIRLLRNHYQDEQFVLILDNNSIDQSKRVKSLLCAVQDLFLPPCSPQLNPIEKLWNTLKSQVRKLPFCSFNQEDQAIHNFFNQLLDIQLGKYMLSGGQLLKMALEKQQF